jgi:hypothetical protein
MKNLKLLLFTGGVSAFLAPRSTTQVLYNILSAMLVPDHYIVSLHENHTLEDHHENIGLNVSEVSETFNFMDLINTYHCRLSNSSILPDLIRHDLGVKVVEHNQYTNWDRPQVADASTRWTTVLPHSLIIKDGQMFEIHGEDGQMHRYRLGRSSACQLEIRTSTTTWSFPGLMSTYISLIRISELRTINLKPEAGVTYEQQISRV